ncbi:hypothetical protein HPHPH5B_0724 [Helicobacter pylori Hp H-5b]|nr:hypothetical protein HPHPH36_0892 [Helicobacter pylori Hp H-36]EJB97277.1 hypothetical protein HPHPP1_0875 [Helicobacter pylori Hp P-1]EJC20136.1 hypothetical protein HPHPP1B_0955 [Helicobacter pylori Hp P-1b]EJC28948.1 hypothetical protein HPHPH5B_0724 [Helicobacter pylori Hp H-5b]EMR57287.1 hypothetical protein A608_0832 [Helicobacter pylori CCHI 33]
MAIDYFLAFILDERNFFNIKFHLDRIPPILLKKEQNEKSTHH